MYRKPLTAFCLIFFPLILNAQELKVGAILPLSGNFASYGTEIRDGLILAAEDAGRSGLKCRVTLEDLPRPGAQAVVALKKLIAEDRIDLIGGNFFNPAMVAMAPILEKEKILAFHTAVADDLILSSGDYVISLNARVRDESRLLVNEMRENGASRVAIAGVATSFGEEYLRHVNSALAKAGTEVVIRESTLLDDVDFKSIAGRMRVSEPDAVFAGYFGVLLGSFVKQLRSAGVKAPIYTVYEAEDPSVVDVAGPALNGIKYYLPDGSPMDPAWREFEAKFVARFGRSPLPLARIAYDSLTLGSKAWKVCNGNRECLKEHVYATPEFHGVSGIIKIEADGGSTREMRGRTFENGTFEDR